MEIVRLQVEDIESEAVGSCEAEQGTEGSLRDALESSFGSPSGLLAGLSAHEVALPRATGGLPSARTDSGEDTEKGYKRQGSGGMSCSHAASLLCHPLA